MSRIKITHGGVVRCDIPNCPERFTTYSLLRLTRWQASKAGWHRPRGASVLDADGLKAATGNRKVDLCPTHGAEHAAAHAERKAAKAAAKKAKAA